MKKLPLVSVILGVVIGTVCLRVSAVNHFHEDSNCRFLFRFEGASYWHRNAIEPNHLSLTNTPTRNTANEPEGSSWSYHDDGDAYYMTDSNHPDCWDGGDFTFCGWFKSNLWWGSTNHWLIRKTDTDANCFKISVYDSGTVEHVRVQLGYNSGESVDVYDHASDLSTGNLYWTGVSVDVDGNILITVFYEDSPKSGTPTQVGTDIDTAVLHALNDESAAWTIGGTGAAMFFDEFVFFDRALSKAELVEIVNGEFGDANDTTFYCDPDDGWLYAAGGTNCPWPALGDLDDDVWVGPYINSGDTIKIREGDEHGNFDLAGSTNDKMTDWVTITQDAGHEDANVQRIDFDAGCYWKLVGNADANRLVVCPHIDGAANGEPDPCNPDVIIGASVGQDPNHLYFQYLDVRTTTDADYATWDSNEWACNTHHGFYLSATEVNILDTDITCTAQGISEVYGNSKIARVDINHFAMDGMYLSGPNITVEDCNIWNTHDIDEDAWANPDDKWHVDLFQLGAGSNSTGFTMRRTNAWITTDPNREDWHIGQGFWITAASFGGVIENVRLIAAHQSNPGINIGFTDSIISDLQLLNITIFGVAGFSDWDDTDDYPDIRFHPSGNYTHVEVRNCIAQDFPSGANIVTSDNLDFGTMTDPNDLFVDSLNHDFTGANDSNYVDQGTDVNTPTDDIRGYDRDESPDIGAFEYGASGDGGGSGYIILGLLSPEEFQWIDPRLYYCFF